MKRNKKKKYFKDGIIGYIQKILTMVIITMILVFLLSLFLKMEFNRVLKFTIIGILSIGALSILGSTSSMHDPKYHYHKAMTGMTDTRKVDLDVLHGSYSFFIFMSITAGVLYLATLLF